MLHVLMRSVELKMRESEIKALFASLNVDDDVQRREIYRILNFQHGTKVRTYGNNPSFYITDSFDKNLYQIEEFVRLVERTKQLPYSIRKERNGGISITPDESISKSIRYIKHWVRYHQTNLVYSPHVELFFQRILSSCYPYEYSDGIPDAIYFGNKTLAEMGNDFVIALRHATGTSEFHKKINDQEENSYRNFKSSVQYVNQLFSRHSRLLYIRIDLSIEYLYIPNDDTALQQILAYHAKFRKLISRKEYPFAHLDGYIAHVEYGTEKGHHIHMSLFYYEQETRADYIISEDVGNAWIKITEGIGKWQSTNRDRHKPSCNALGRIHRDNTEKRYCLYYTLWYTVKPDQYLKFKYHKDQRLFFRGGIGYKRVGRKIKAFSRKHPSKAVQ